MLDETRQRPNYSDEDEDEENDDQKSLQLFSDSNQQKLAYGKKFAELYLPKHQESALIEDKTTPIGEEDDQESSPSNTDSDKDGENSLHNFEDSSSQRGSKRTGNNATDVRRSNIFSRTGDPSGPEFDNELKQVNEKKFNAKQNSYSKQPRVTT